MMGAAKATYEQLWKHKMQQIKDINEATYHWLYNLERTTWCKYDFSHYPKCGNWVATWGGDRHFEVTDIASVEEVEFKLVLFSIKRMILHKSNVQTKTIR